MRSHSCIGLVLLAALAGLPGCNVPASMQPPPRLDTPVKYSINGQKMQIPLRYHYWESVKRSNRWPRPKPGFREVEHLEITALLPDLAPYRDDNRLEFEKPGHGNRISISLGKNTLRPLPEYLAIIGGRLTAQSSTLPGLSRLSEPRGSNNVMEDLYLKTDTTGAYFTMRCVHNVPSPGCKVTRIDENGLVLMYSFSATYLEYWNDIGESIDALMAGFHVD